MAPHQSFTCASCGLETSEVLLDGRCRECLLSDDDHECPLTNFQLPPTEDLAATVDTETSRLESGGSSESDSKLVGDYDIIREIARGGMGVVYQARHRTLGRDVALKLILSGGFASENDVRRFHLEAESAAAMDHPGIVAIYEIGQHDGHHFFTMKLIDGGSLAENMQRFRADIRALVVLLANVADAIDYAHRRGILHRDLKPANILLDPDGYPVVTDLGLAKHTDCDSDLTGSGAIVGTPAYMPPEQANASKQITTAVDIYSLGAILYDGITGQPPHKAESAVATLLEAARGDIVEPSRLNPRIDRTLELICMKCLAHNPAERYASASELKNDLQNWLLGKAVSVKPKTLVSICGDLIGQQLRSVLGAMLLGVIGGLALGIPLYSGIANRLFGKANARFNLDELSKQLPSSDIVVPWWLQPPESLVTFFTLLGIPFCLFLGVMIRRLVRPQDIRQAVAVGLVAGLLMTIVQFAIYGIAASWQTFALANANQIEQLALAGFLDEPGKLRVISELLDQHPELTNRPGPQQATLVSKLVSIKLMLTSPPVTIGCLSACLIFAGVFCLLGTTHAYRLTQTDFTAVNRTLRYTEVIILSTAAGLLACVYVFMFFGMIQNAQGTIHVRARELVALSFLVAAIGPGWLHAKWFVRWSGYILATVLTTAILIN
ncbi:serine/threonine protein kinase [Stieleria sp. JC731]|uniref:serine/threonine-protein kinase n=1 Tax=Pirellulaceae TaxID=2691357 RepID=UPI001E2DC022|nr:serine/threonine-protein kinase [Stieleria sp. JC731]MCC9600957.1 serine/threonine protein kinase [Stieleria sp. JC731]